MQCGDWQKAGPRKTCAEGLACAKDLVMISGLQYDL